MKRGPSIRWVAPAAWVAVALAGCSPAASLSMASGGSPGLHETASPPPPAEGEMFDVELDMSERRDEQKQSGGMFGGFLRAITGGDKTAAPPPKVEGPAGAVDPGKVAQGQNEVTIDNRAKPAEDEHSGGGSADPPKRGRIQSASSRTMDATIDAGTVRQMLEDTKQVFKSCVQTDSIVALEITVAASGAVSEAFARTSEPDDPLMRDCVASKFKSLRFPASTSGRDARMSLRLALRPD